MNPLRRLSRKSGRGFTLIELILVVVILGVILAFAIPALLRKRSVNDYAAAQGALRNILSAEAVWRAADNDGNSLPDYWTADVFGLYALADGAGRPVEQISADLAFADRDPALAVAGSMRPRPYFAAPFPRRPEARTGYYVEALVNDETGAPYAQDGKDADTKATENPRKFGFMAIPCDEVSPGTPLLIISEEGVIYELYSGAVPGVNTMSWPAADPTTASPPWRVRP